MVTSWGGGYRGPIEGRESGRTEAQKAWVRTLTSLLTEVFKRFLQRSWFDPWAQGKKAVSLLSRSHVTQDSLKFAV